MLKVHELSYQYNEQILFSNLTFYLNQNSLLLFTGHNGSGKSTLLKIIAGLLCPHQGSVSWKGDLLKDSATFLSELLFIGHKTGISLALTLFENLKWEICKQKEMDSVLKKLGLWDFKDTPCEMLSAGLRQRVALAKLWLQPAALWLLDEPLTALDQTGQQLFLEHLSNHIEKGGMAIVASHQAIQLNALKNAQQTVLNLGTESCG